jgi:Fe-S-cluster containining protein
MQTAVQQSAMSSARRRIELKIHGEPLTVVGDSPIGPARLDEVLPFFRKVDDAVIDRAVARVEAAGEKVSCAKGCSACCRAQPVPVTPPEAYALLRLVEVLPEPRRSAVRELFAKRVSRLKEAGLHDSFLHRDPNMTREGARELADRYFRLGLVCPFLVDDACGIYVDRPFVCRQYLVTSPASLCTDPFHNPVKPVPMPLRFAFATLAVAEQKWGPPQHTVPLTLALEYAEANRTRLEQQFDGKETTDQFTKALATGG